MTRARRVVLGGVLLGTLLLDTAACTSSGTPRAAVNPSSPVGTGSDATTGAATGAATRSFTAVRWWSDAAGGVGSPIDVQHPTSAASTLHPSRADYCRMLRQTVSAGTSLTSGVAASDPALHAATRAYLAELTAVAPTSLTSAWQKVGELLLGVVTGGSRPSVPKGDELAKVAADADLIARDAQDRCHTSLRGTTVKLAG
ncbi:MAG: hypothetical protein ACTHMS_04320 [Jatrophihabitans sp.]|uniref:hypothetical protein n=1 Tax=Jatrophihabitans sp. TaxID=1932789 RepID=UPI003F8005C6